MICVILTVVALAGGASPGGAGEGSGLRVIGFSPDGRRFAFEQSGTKDGSGHLYAAISVTGPGGGSLERVVEGDDAPDEAAEATVRAAARPLLEADGGVGSPATLIASVAAAKAGEALLPMDVPDVFLAAARQIEVSHPALGGPARVVLSERPRTGESCKDFEGAVDATIRFERAGGAAVLLDGQPDPPVGLCPTRFGLAAVYLHEAPGASALAIVVQAFPIGFEGSDRRFFAVLALLDR